MKKKYHHLITGLLMTILALATTVGFASCQDDETSMKWVDLRYNPQSDYQIPAKGAEEITFEVKSTDPWEVYGQTDWCTISPDQGPADEVCKVTLTFKDNEGLDDRTDTLTIKSDYWIGKRFTVSQKGIAYLTVETTEPITLSKEMDSKSFDVKANQDWTTKVTTDSKWLSITGGSAGKLDGKVIVTTTVNKGEQRTGEVTVYDRHGVQMAIVTVIQEGVMLQPERMVIKTLHEGRVFKLKVASNAEWTIRKSDEDMEWYTLPVTSFNGAAEVEIVIDENTGSSTRRAELILSTKVVEGVEPVVKTIILKQGNEPEAIRYEFTAADLGSRWKIDTGTPKFDGDGYFEKARVSQDNCVLGLYSFRVKTMSADAFPMLYFTYSKKEIRFHINATSGTTDISTAPWLPLESKNVAFDITKPHTYSLRLSDKEGFMFIEWILDGEIFASIWANSGGLMINPDEKSLVYFGCNPGNALFDWYEYTPPIDWGGE